MNSRQETQSAILPAWAGRWVRVEPWTPALALTIMLGVTLDITGALHVYGLGFLMSQKLAAGTALLLVGIALGWLLVAKNVQQAPDTRYQTSSRYILPRLLVLLLLTAWLATMRNFLVFLAPDGNPLHLALFGAGLFILGFALVRPLPTAWLLFSIVLLGSLVRVASFSYVPIDPARDDMLPLVQQALNQLLAGQTPYTIYQMPWDLPLTYLPVTWLAYLPTYLIGLDIRLTNLLAELGIGATIVWLTLRMSSNSSATPGNPDDSDQPDCWHFPMLLWAWFFLQPTALNWSLATTAPVQWALLSLTLTLVIANRHLPAALALGLLGAATPLAAIIAPFVLLHWLRAHGWWHTLILAGLAGLLAALFILPFLLWSPEHFRLGAWRWFNDNELYPRLRWDMDHTWARQVGFSGIFWRHGFVGLLKPLQAVLLASLIIVYWRWGASVRQLAPVIVAAFLLFMVFNPVLWPYLYTPALVVALLALVPTGAQRVPLPGWHSLKRAEGSV